MTAPAPVFNLVTPRADATDPIAVADTNYRAMRAYWMANQAVICPKCKAGFAVSCQSTGGGHGGPVPTHKARTVRVSGWSDEQRHKYGELARKYHHAPWDAPAALVAEAEAAAAPVPAAKPNPTNPKSVRLSELQAEEIEGFAYRGGKGSASTAHFHGDHQHRQTINALVAKGILAEGGYVNHGYDREYTLTGFGWQVYLNHRLIFRNSEGDRWAALLASQNGSEAAS